MGVNSIADPRIACQRLRQGNSIKSGHKSEYKAPHPELLNLIQFLLWRFLLLLASIARLSCDQRKSESGQIEDKNIIWPTI